MTTDHAIRETFARRVLWANAGFSALSGIVLVIDAAMISNWMFAGHPSIFGLTMTVVLRTTGVGLLLFAAFVAWAAVRRDFDSGHVAMISAADLSWVVCSVIGVVLGAGWLTPAGGIVIAAAAVIVLGFGLGQLRILA
jgi:hypothetical protein